MSFRPNFSIRSPCGTSRSGKSTKGKFVKEVVLRWLTTIRIVLAKCFEGERYYETIPWSPSPQGKGCSLINQMSYTRLQAKMLKFGVFLKKRLMQRLSRKKIVVEVIRESYVEFSVK